MDSFYLEQRQPGDWSWEGRRGILDGNGREGEEKSAVNDYHCKMAVCWTEITP